VYNERSSSELDGVVRQVLAVVTATVRPQLPLSVPLLQVALFILAISVRCHIADCRLTDCQCPPVHIDSEAVLLQL
jgi:hypothetical protein